MNISASDTVDKQLGFRIVRPHWVCFGRGETFEVADAVMASPHTGVHSQQAATWCNKDAFPGCNPVGFTWFFTIGVSDPWPLAILASDHCPHHVVHYWIHPAGNVALSSVESVAYEVGRRNT